MRAVLIRSGWHRSIQQLFLSRQIADKKKKDRDLQNAIVAIVRREIKAAEDAAKAKAKAEADEKKKADDLAKKNKPAENPTTKPGTNPAITNPVITTTTTTATKRNEPAKKPESYLDLNAKDVALNKKLELNRAKLPWPVDNGVVTMTFGNNKIDNTLLTFIIFGISLSC